jgi:phospholipid/cholesterol/gamma-HCH transport system ATP-binding protein
MGMLFQFGALFTDMSVFDNVAFPLREHTDLPAGMIRDLVLMKLQAVGLRGAAKLMPASSPAAWRGAWRWRARWRSTRC